MRPHLRRREAPPPLIDELIRLTYRAIIDGYAKRPRSDPRKKRK
jgi:hypothetical protein